MTLEKLFSKEVSQYIVELNKKYPNMTNEEFGKMVNEYIERRGDNLITEGLSGLDFDEDEDEDEGTDEESTETIVEEPEPEKEPVKEPVEKTVKKPVETVSYDVEDDDPISSFGGKKDDSPVDDDDDDDPLEKLEDEEKEIEKKRKEKEAAFKTATTHKVGKKTKYIDDTGHVSTLKTVKARKPVDGDDRYIMVGGVKRRIVSNTEDPHENIFRVVNAWYDRCITNGTGENEQVKTSISLLYTEDVVNMEALFAYANVPRIDLSAWDVSNVENMEGMFYRSTFNNDSIKNWDVSSCINFNHMFTGSKFSQDISDWVPGEYEDFVYSSDGEIERYFTVDEDTGLEISVPRKRKVRAQLPKVGARLTEIENETDAEICASLDALGVFDDTEEEEIKENYTNMSKKHILTIEEFVNEGFYDKFKSGIKKSFDYMKSKLQSLKLKLNNFFVANINPETGELIKATDVVTTINYIETEKPKGVKVFANNVESPLIVDGVEEIPNIQDTNERYGWIKKGSVEYKNYLEFMRILAENSEEDGVVNEARTGLGAAKSGLNSIVNITTDGLKEKITRVMLNVPRKTGRTSARSMVVYGAPGIGKTTIPKEIIKQWNKDHKNEKKAVIVVECGDLELGGFNIPLPREHELSETIYANSAVRKKLEDEGYTEADFEALSNTKVLRTDEAPKTWLPVFSKYGTKAEVKAAQAAANGRRIVQMVRRDDGDWDMEFEDTCHGGLLIFDEFLRADPELFKTIGQLVVNRAIGHGEYILGDEWGIICCSNRPVDDSEVEKNFLNQPPAMANRFLEGTYNFIPDFYDWLNNWARTDGHFDESTIKFLSRDKFIDASDNKETYTVGYGKKQREVTVYKNWHNIDVQQYLAGNQSIITTPRGWSALMEWVQDELRITGGDSIFDLDMDDLEEQACAVIGDEIGKEYGIFMRKQKKLYFSGERPKPIEFFEHEIDKIDTKAYSVSEATKDIAKYVELNYSKNSVKNGDKTIGVKFYTMAKNVDKFYSGEYSGGAMSSEIKYMHNKILLEILKVTKKLEDKRLRINLKDYILYVCAEERYDIQIPDEEM